jgi:hypothetical protein
MTMRFAGLILLVCAVSAGPLTAQQAPNRFDRQARVHEYAASLTDAVSWGNVAASTLLDQILDDPETWSFGDRALSNSGRFVLEVSLYHGIAAMQDRSTWYHPCECTDIPGRAAHAFAEAFTDYDRSGAAHLSTARIGAPYGAAVAEALWRPDVSIGDALVTGSRSLIFTGLFNIVREFVR